jgi:hypothetical protein
VAAVRLLLPTVGRRDIFNYFFDIFTVQLNSKSQINKSKIIIIIIIIIQETAKARVGVRSAETQLTPHTCTMSSVGQNFWF